MLTEYMYDVHGIKPLQNASHSWCRYSTLDYIRSSVNTNECLVSVVGASIEKGTKMYIWDCFDIDDDDHHFKWDV